MHENKMDMAEAGEPSSSRRRFLWKVWLGLGGLALAECVWIVVSFLRPRKPRAAGQDSGNLIIAGPVEQFERNSVRAFQKGKFYLARLEDGGFLALYRACTHLGCTVPWMEEEKRFICPCHSSAFDIRGDVTSPPAPRALDLYPVRIENGIVKVDISTPIRRKSFEVSQVTHP
jgi:cytochrome b6-f complex iron-sulfur subunit